jgi:small subunit ribosomal protein S3
MGHKVNPKSFRMGINQTWSSRWFVRENYPELVKEDVLIRKFVRHKLKEAGIDKVEIERTRAEMVLNITAARPGMIIGRGGEGIEELKKEIVSKFFKNKQLIKVNIQEVDNPNLSAEVMLYYMITDIEKRIPFRRVMKQSIERVMKAGALGVKITISGRLNGVEIARTETLAEGKIPLHTLRANIEYAKGAAFTTYGAVGIKIWIYKKEVFSKEKTKETVNK